MDLERRQSIFRIEVVLEHLDWRTLPGLPFQIHPVPDVLRANQSFKYLDTQGCHKKVSDLSCKTIGGPQIVLQEDVDEERVQNLVKDD